MRGRTLVKARGGALFQVMAMAVVVVTALSTVFTVVVPLAYGKDLSVVLIRVRMVARRFRCRRLMSRRLRAQAGEAVRLLPRASQ